MPYQLTWHLDRRIIFQHVWDDMDAEAIQELSDLTIQRLDEGIAPVHLIADLSAMKEFPTSLTVLRAAITYIRHPSLGWVVLVRASPLATLIGNLISHTAGLKIEHCETIEEAAAFLQKQDETLAINA